MQALDTMGRDGLADCGATRTSWTLRTTIESSSPAARAIGAAAVTAALATTLHSDVPLASGVAVAALVPAAMVDVLDRRIPNPMVAGAAAIGLAVAVIMFLLGGELDAAGAAVGIAACAGPLLAMHLISPPSMGFGDVKAAAVLGAALGLIHPLFGLVALTAGSFAAAVAGLIRRRRTIAFGPALVGGAVLALVLATAPIDVVATGGGATSDATPKLHLLHRSSEDVPS